MKSLFKVAILSTLLLMLNSCQSDIQEANHTLKEQNLNLRTSEATWLHSFQNHLKILSQEKSSSTVYSLNEVLLGIEQLLNIKHSTLNRGLLRLESSKTINLDYTPSDIDIFNLVNASLEEDISGILNDEEIEFGFLELSQASTENGIEITIETHTKDVSECSVNHFFPPEDGHCDREPFEPGEAYYGGWYGFEDDDDWAPEHMCPKACGDVDACENTSDFALEQLENHLQTSIDSPKCPEPLVWAGTYSDIRRCGDNIEWDFWEYHFEGEDGCILIENQDDFVTHDDGRCYCFNADVLNCMYESLCEAMQNGTYPLGSETCWPALTADHVLIDIDLASDFLWSSPGHTNFVIESWYGIPDCVTGIVGPTHEHALEMDLPYK